jgi:hypothetical protein
MDAKNVRNADGELNVNLEDLLSMAGYGPKTTHWEYEGGLVHFLILGKRSEHFGPFEVHEVRREALQIIEKARRWIHSELRGFKRYIKLTEWDAVQLWKLSTMRGSTIVRCKVGDTVNIPRQGESHFGSGEAWGVWKVYGEVTENVTESHDTGFVDKETVSVTFDHGPAVVYSAAGDRVNEGRTFYRKLYVAE